MWSLIWCLLFLVFKIFYTVFNHDGSFSISDRVHKEGEKKTNGPRIEPRGTPEYLISALKHKANEGHRQCWPVVVFTKVILKFKVLFLKPHTSKCLCLEEKGHAWRFGIDLYSSSNFIEYFSRVEYSEYLFVFVNTELIQPLI